MTGTNCINFLEKLNNKLTRDDLRVRQYFEKKKEDVTCIVCYENEADRVLKCCHKLCGNCYDKLCKCPLCRCYYKSTYDDGYEYENDSEAYIDTDEYLAQEWYEHYKYELDGLTEVLRNTIRVSKHDCIYYISKLNSVLNTGLFLIENDVVVYDQDRIRTLDQYLHLSLDSSQVGLLKVKAVVAASLVVKHCRMVEKRGVKIAGF